MARIEIEIEDILWDMSDYEKQELVDELYADGFVAKNDNLNGSDDDLSDWDLSVKKLLGNSWRLSKEDEQTILEITKKLI